MAGPVRFTRQDVRFLTIAAVGALLIVTAFTTSWWTRGYTVEHGDDASAGDDFPAFLDTLTVSYGPFSTPSFGPFQFDSVREVAVTVTGIAVALAAIFATASMAVRWGVSRGRVDADDGVAVKLAIASVWLGLFGVLFVLLWPFIGVNGDGYYSSEEVFGGDGSAMLVENKEFLNVGFYVGILGFVAYPAYLWYAAHAAREQATTTAAGKRAKARAA
jgi:hypothetical protein